MNAVLALIGGTKGILVLVLLAALGGYIAYQKNAVSEAELARDQAIVLRDAAAGERDKAIAAARVNEETISRLQQEKELTNQALNTLQTALINNRSSAVAREIIIQSTAGEPANAGVAAPVLGNIITEIQTDRLRRRGLTTPTTADATAKRVLE